MIKIALAQLNLHTGDFAANTQQILQSIETAKSENADLVVFPELAICGYPPMDFLDISDFVEICEQHVQTIAEYCVGIAAIVGSPTQNPNERGRILYNSAYFLADGKVAQVVHKTLLPTYDVFDEARYFQSNTEFNIIHFKNQRIALTICEDIWNVEDHPLYTQTPMDELKKFQPNLMINIAASPFSYTQQETRREILNRNNAQYGLPIVYVNKTGAQTDLIFDGNSVALNAQNQIVAHVPAFETGITYCTFNGKDFSDLPIAITEKTKYELITKAICLGISDYFKKLGFKKAIIGLSGGVDSALVTALAVKALGKENVHVLMMPSMFSSDHSISDSLKLVENLGITHDILPITQGYDAMVETLKSPFEGLVFNIAEENIQSRLRGLLLMAYTNKFGYILLNTSNKSELAVGYGTLYGDMAGGLSVIGDLYKTEVFELCRYLNKDGEIIPTNIIEKAPSAELRPNQKDSDSLPDYAILDEILFQYIEKHQSKDRIIAAGFDKALVERTLRMVNLNEYKRFQFAPIIRISTKAFGRGRRVPLVAKYLI